MPYVTPTVRDEIEAGRPPETVGELTYCLYKISLAYLGLWEDTRYHHYAEVMAALECTKLELARRHLAPFEDKKIELNGDVDGV